MKTQNIEKFADEILAKREDHPCNTQLKNQVIEYFKDLIDFLFPHFSSKVYYTREDVLAKLQLLERNLITVLKSLTYTMKNTPEEVASGFITELPAIHNKLWDDAESIFKGDPAAESVDEVILAYPGFMAILIYRVANPLYNLGAPLIPRILTEYAHELTGIDIHPGAKIGSPFFIDHGTGIVIGETSEIGKNVKLYQGVTLGALSVDKVMASTKRHPTIEDDVIIYSQAVILGGNTVIGKNSIIGGNSWIIQSVPQNSVVYNKIEVRVRTNNSGEPYMDFVI